MGALFKVGSATASCHFIELEEVKPTMPPPGFRPDHRPVFRVTFTAPGRPPMKIRQALAILDIKPGEFASGAKAGRSKKHYREAVEAAAQLVAEDQEWDELESGRDREGRLRAKRTRRPSQVEWLDAVHARLTDAILGPVDAGDDEEGLALLSETERRLELAKKQPPASKAMIQRAREQYGDVELEVDPDALTSPSDGGAWVAAWVFVRT